jgi:hypothetical protein
VQNRIVCKKIEDSFVVARFGDKIQRLKTICGIKAVAELSDVAEWMIEHHWDGRRPRFRPSRVWVGYPGVRVFINVVIRVTGVILILPAEDESSLVFDDRRVAAGSWVRFVCVVGIVVLIDQ